MIAFIDFVSFIIVLSQDIIWSFILLLLIMNIDSLLQWLHTLIINLILGKYWRISSLSEPLWLLPRDHILLNLNVFAWISLY